MAEVIVVILVILGALNFFLSKSPTPKAEQPTSTASSTWAAKEAVVEEGKTYTIRAGTFGLARLDDFKEFSRLVGLGLKREAMEHALSSPGFLDLDGSTSATVLDVTWDGDWAHVVVDPSRKKVWTLCKSLNVEAQ